MTKFFIPSGGPEAWKNFLVEPEKQWKTGFSAKSLAYCWEEAKSFPKEVRSALEGSGVSTFRSLELLLALPEHQVPLPGGHRPSQNDIFVLGRASDGLVAIAVEGKVDEPFGPTLEEWSKGSSEGKNKRLKFLGDTLDKDFTDASDIRYQLIHRTASAVILANEFFAKDALMLVHSFSQENSWFEDYTQFVELFGAKAELNQITRAYNSIRGVNLYFGWVKGSTKYLKK